MELYNLKTAYPLIESLYGLEIGDDFEDIALTGWELIGNKHTRLYRFIGKSVNCELKLPCNVDQIESVHIPINDAQMTSNKFDFIDNESLAIEGYIDSWKYINDPFNQNGKLIKYKEGNNTLYFSRDYPKIIVIYQGILVDDEDGLPLINDKEAKAIAAYVAYAELFKEGIQKRNQNSINLAQTIKLEWLQKCNSARIPKHVSQNDINSILDVKFRADRKQFGKSLKPIL